MSVPGTVINLFESDRHVIVIFDGQSSAVLTVLCQNGQIVSWWSGRVSADVALQGYRERMGATLRVPPRLQAVMDRRWPEIAVMRAEYP